MKNNFDYILLAVLVLLGFLTRTVFHIAPNVEFVTVASLAAGYFFSNKKLALLVPLSIMISTDIVIGNTSIFIFTWSGFIFTAILGYLFSLEKSLKFLKGISSMPRSMIIGFGGSILSVLFFFLWTNFGVVITTTMYPDTLTGLVNSYVNALPFLKNQLVGNIFFAPMIFAIIHILKEYIFFENHKQSLKAT